MRARTLRAGFAAMAAAAGLGAFAACGGGGGGHTAPVVPEPPRPILDAVAAVREDFVLVFRDVLHKSFGDISDVVLDRPNSGIARPTGVLVDANRLYVSCYDRNQVLIFDDFANLTSGATPNVTLNGTYGPNRLVVAGGDLYVACQSSQTVEVFRDVTTLASGDTPDVTLNGVGYCKDVLVADDALYVACYNDDEVQVFRGLAGLTSGQAPDVVLDMTGSLVRQPIRLAAHADTLYVSNRYNAVCLFRGLAGLTSGQFPDVVLGGPSSLDGVRRPLVTSTRLFVPNQWADVGMCVFDDPATLVNGQFPDAVLHAPVDDVSASDLLRNALLGFTRDSEVFFVYFDAEGIVTDQPPDIQLWDPRVVSSDVGELILVDGAL